MDPALHAFGGGALCFGCLLTLKSWHDFQYKEYSKHCKGVHQSSTNSSKTLDMPPVVRTQELPLHGARVQSLDGELRSCMPQSVA